jgi:predicted nuclease with TOPRIM domain
MSDQFMGHGYYRGMEETYSKRIEELMKENAELKAEVKRYAGRVYSTDAKNEKLERVAKCLEMTRGQWIHSVNAQECLKALADLEKGETA